MNEKEFFELLERRKTEDNFFEVVRKAWEIGRQHIDAAAYPLSPRPARNMYVQM
ncbi:hypothetical protein CIP107509_00189 [Corynebacterium diphtheriae]|uniref:hypothetical protein n=1 Tax=Corynebacterium diphtheriae TaxID=1717 RepID=UPI0013C8F728|nr:hypothetical protein [Corynebacterium diphtheriae]CAB0533990.1 hypothetical protein CIP107509_00189 [Corynebacterium diphtheriae]CAB0672622.1 hypothetical protein FRC0038_00041 [Corynebacterium diphtheriae]CAB0799619.1 hypothetical protein FRC0268_00230 [Corynebacterium diphtheriae]